KISKSPLIWLRDKRSQCRVALKKIRRNDGGRRHFVRRCSKRDRRVAWTERCRKNNHDQHDPWCSRTDQWLDSHRGHRCGKAALQGAGMYELCGCLCSSSRQSHRLSESSSVRIDLRCGPLVKPHSPFAEGI